MKKQNKSSKLSSKNNKLLITAVVFAFAVGAIGVYSLSASQAARPEKSGSISLNYDIYPRPKLGDTISFDATVSKNVRNGRIQVLCYQNSKLVYAEAGPYDGTFMLGGASSDWQANGGAASCRADLLDLWWNGKNDPQNVDMLDSMQFSAEDSVPTTAL